MKRHQWMEMRLIPQVFILLWSIDQRLGVNQYQLMCGNDSKMSDFLCSSLWPPTWGFGEYQTRESGYSEWFYGSKRITKGSLVIECVVCQHDWCMPYCGNIDIDDLYSCLAYSPLPSCLYRMLWVSALTSLRRAWRLSIMNVSKESM